MSEALHEARRETLQLLYGVPLRSHRLPLQIAPLMPKGEMAAELGLFKAFGGRQGYLPATNLPTVQRGIPRYKELY